MRVIFLGSAYFGYVYTYTFDPDTYNNAEVQALPAQSMLPATTEVRPTPKTSRKVSSRLAAWLSQSKQEATC